MNRTILAAAVVILVAVASPDAANGFPLSPQDSYANVPTDSPGGALRMCLVDLVVNVKPEDRPYTKYISLFMVKTLFGDKALDPREPGNFRTALRIQLNRVSASNNPVPEVEVDGPRGSAFTTPLCTLIRVNIKFVPNWTRTAWVLVADRDYLFREAPLGLLPHRETQFGRIMCGIQQNAKTLSAGFVLSGWQLFRDTMEKAKVETGHDLLYGYERHPDPDHGVIDFIDLSKEAVSDKVEVPAPAKASYPYNAKVTADRAFVVDERRVVKKELHSGDGFQVTNKPNEYGYVYGVTGKGKSGSPPVEGFILVDSIAFDPDRNPKPATEAPKVVKGAKGVPLAPKRPISVDDANKGRKDFPATLDDFQKRWGVRAREEKLKTFLFDTSVGGIALAADSAETGGSFVAAGGDRVVKIENGEFGVVMTTFDSFASVDENDQIERDQWFLIVEGKIKFDGGESLATMPNGMQAEFLFNANKESVNIADTRLAKHLEKVSSDPRYPDVRVGFCASCHAGTDGYNTFVEQYTDTKSRGVKFNVPTGREQEVQDFYEGWQKKVRRWQLPYQEFREIVGTGGKAVAGKEMWSVMMAWRDRYDKPVDIKYVAAEFGYKADDLREILMQKVESQGPPQTRLNQLVVDKSVPKRTYEANVSGAAALWIDLVKPKHEKVRELVAPQVLEDAIKRFGITEKGK